MRTPASAVPAPGRFPIEIRHRALVRLTHWLNVPLLAGLIVSGLAIYWAAPVYHHAPDFTSGSTDYVGDIGIWITSHVPGLRGYPRPQTWVYDHFSIGPWQLAVALRLHWLFAYLFMANGVLYLFGLLAGGGYKALLPRRTDLRDALRMVRHYAGWIPAKLLRRAWPHPVVTTKYNALQRAAYLAMPVCGSLAVLSGWAMHKPVQLPRLERLFVSYDGARVVHFWLMILFAAFVGPHVVLVVADGWDTLRSMITGWSKRIPGGGHGAA